jgi:hypothetical protein
MRNRLTLNDKVSGWTLKDWFIQEVQELLDEYEQPSLLPKAAPTRGRPQ